MLYHHTNFNIYFVSEILPEAICCYIVYRDLITKLIIEVLKCTIIQNFTFSRAFISQI